LRLGVGGEGGGGGGEEGGARRAAHAQERLAGALAGTWAVRGSGGGGGVFGMKRSALKQCVVLRVGWGGGAGSELGRDAGRAWAGRGARGASRPALSAPRTAAPTAAAAAADAGGGWWWRRGLGAAARGGGADSPSPVGGSRTRGRLRRHPRRHPQSTRFHRASRPAVPCPLTLPRHTRSTRALS